MKLAVIFEERPQTWGFRGDPYFWQYLEYLAEEMDIISEDELEQWIKDEHLALTGKAMTGGINDYGYVEQFSHGGMTSGGISGYWWIEKGIPLLRKRLREIKQG